HDAPPLNETAVTSPRAPPLDQRSCWKTPITLPGACGLTATHGSTSAFTLLVPGGEPGSSPVVQAANGLGTDAVDSGPTAAGPAKTGAPMASAPTNAPAVARSGLCMRPPKWSLPPHVQYPARRPATPDGQTTHLVRSQQGDHNRGAVRTSGRRACIG